MIDNLYGKDSKAIYDEFLALERTASESNELYQYIDEFIRMLDSDMSYTRVRGFRLICANAKWDDENIIDMNIDKILEELNDETSTAVRQCLKSLHTLLLYKTELNEQIKDKLLTIDVMKYKETMQGLIKKDIDEILDNL